MEKQYKILYIITKSVLGGAQKYVLEIIKGLPENCQPYFIMSNAGYLSEELKKLGISEEQLFFVPMTNSIFDIKTHIKSNLKVLKIIKEMKPDLIHAHTTTAGIVGRLCGFLTHTPVIYTVHGWSFTPGIPFKKRIFYSILESFLSIFTQKFICVSEYDRQLGIKLMPYYKNKFQTVLSRIPDTNPKYIKNHFSTDELKIFMVSRCCPQKDPYTLIKAINELNIEGKNIKLDFFGYGEDVEKVKNLINNCKCDNIKFCGSITNLDYETNGLDKFDVAPILPNYDIYALISNWEGLPAGLEEGMRSGLPIIASDVGGNSELIRNNGYIIPRGNVAVLKEKLCYLYEHKELLAIMGKNSRSFYEEEFKIEKMINEVINIYEVILNVKLL